MLSKGELTALSCGHRIQRDRRSAAGDCFGLGQRSSMNAIRPGADDRLVAAFDNEPLVAITCQ